MKRLTILAVAALSLGTVASASEHCAPDPARADLRLDLLDTLASSENERAGRAAANDIWALWTRAPSSEAQALLDEGMRSIRYGEPAAAEHVLNDLVVLCPDFPEGWNQRAFARFLKGDFDGSLADIETTLDLEPAHFGAYSGKIMILVKQGRTGLARLTLIEALKFHPWMQERALLKSGADL